MNGSVESVAELARRYRPRVMTSLAVVALALALVAACGGPLRRARCDDDRPPAATDATRWQAGAASWRRLREEVARAPFADCDAFGDVVTGVSIAHEAELDLLRALRDETHGRFDRWAHREATHDPHGVDVEARVSERLRAGCALTPRAHDTVELLFIVPTCARLQLR